MLPLTNVPATQVGEAMAVTCRIAPASLIATKEADVIQMLSHPDV